MPDPVDHRARITRNNCRPVTLALIERHYPRLLASQVLGCCRRQLAGDYRRCCRNALCPACCPRESHTIAKTQYDAFRACTPRRKAGPRLAHEVYTLPPHLHPHIRSREGLTAWRNAVRATTREIHAADVAGVMNLHPHGDEDLTKWHPHWDVVLNGYLVTPTGRVLEHRPRSIHYDDARAIYRRHLAAAFKLDLAAIPEVNLWLDRKHQVFHSHPRKTWHIVRYSARHVYQPQFAWLVPASDKDWWYKPWAKARPVAFPGGHVIANLLALRAWLHGKQRRVWFGYMTGRDRKKAVEAFRCHDAVFDAGASP